MNETPKQLKDRAAKLVAEAEYELGEIAAQIGVTVRTLHNWRKTPSFRAKVSEIAREMESESVKRAIAKKSYRIRTLANMHRRILTVMDERAVDPEMATVSGGRTGLMVRKAIVSGGSLVGYEFVADVGLLKEMRAIQEQAAKELGQLVEKHEHKIRSLKDLTDEELAAMAIELDGSSADEPDGTEGDPAEEEGSGESEPA